MLPVTVYEWLIKALETKITCENKHNIWYLPLFVRHDVLTAIYSWVYVHSGAGQRIHQWVWAMQNHSVSALQCGHTMLDELSSLLSNSSLSAPYSRTRLDCPLKDSTQFLTGSTKLGKEDDEERVSSIDRLVDVLAASGNNKYTDDVDGEWALVMSRNAKGSPSLQVCPCGPTSTPNLLAITSRVKGSMPVQMIPEGNGCSDSAGRLGARLEQICAIVQ